jgi:hypothetical protein
MGPGRTSPGRAREGYQPAGSDPGRFPAGIGGEVLRRRPQPHPPPRARVGEISTSLLPHLPTNRCPATAANAGGVGEGWGGGVGGVGRGGPVGEGAEGEGAADEGAYNRVYVLLTAEWPRTPPAAPARRWTPTDSLTTV